MCPHTLDKVSAGGSSGCNLVGAASFCAAAVAVIRQVIVSAVARPEIPSDARTAKERGQKGFTDGVRLSPDTKRESFLQEVMSRIIGVYKIQSSIN